MTFESYYLTDRHTYRIDQNYITMLLCRWSKLRNTVCRCILL